MHDEFFDVLIQIFKKTLYSELFLQVKFQKDIKFPPLTPS